MDDQSAPPSQPPDSDAVIKGFGQASETTLLLQDALKLFLACKRPGVHNPYEDISDDDALALCTQPGPVPEHLKAFILWQRNIVKVDSDEILKTEIPKGFKSKYDVKGARLSQMARDEERMAAIQIFQDEQERYFQKFNTVRAILEAAEDRFLTIEDLLLRAESMDEALIYRLKEEKDALEEIRKALCDMRATLEDIALPDIIRFEDAPDKVQNFMIRLSHINVALRDCIRTYQSEIDGTQD